MKQKLHQFKRGLHRCDDGDGDAVATTTTTTAMMVVLAVLRVLIMGNLTNVFECKNDFQLVFRCAILICVVRI